jgi:hypothetical protein
MGIILAIFAIYLAIRNHWAFHWQRKINKAVYNFRMDIVKSWSNMSVNIYT